MPNYGITPRLLGNLMRIDGLNEPRVQKTLEVIRGALGYEGITTSRALIVTLGTVMVECPSFVPQREWGDERYFRETYGDDLGPYIDGFPKYAGRGLIQLTWGKNYRYWGTKLGIPLYQEPDRALDLDVAVKILTGYLQENGCYKLAIRWDREADDEYLKDIRRAVNGGLNGYKEFSHYCHELKRYVAKLPKSS